MTPYDEIDKLLDLSLNGEANDNDLAKLESLIQENNSHHDYYLQSIDEQVTLRSAMVSIEPSQELIDFKTKGSKLPTWLIISLTILMTVIYIAFQKINLSQPEQLTVAARSYGVSLIRQQQEIHNLANVLLMTGDLVRVEEDGELWLNLDNHHTIFISGESIIKINHYSQESLTLIKGELTSISNSNSKPLT